LVVQLEMSLNPFKVRSLFQTGETAQPICYHQEWIMSQSL